MRTYTSKHGTILLLICFMISYVAAQQCSKGMYKSLFEILITLTQYINPSGLKTHVKRDYWYLITIHQYS